MDIYCTRCGEPWEIDTFHDIIAEQHADTLEALRLEHYGVRTVDEVYGTRGTAGVWTSATGRAFQAAYERTLWAPMLDRFYLEGCVATGWTRGLCEPRRTLRGDAMSALADVMGDDVDGIAAMLDDLDHLGEW